MKTTISVVGKWGWVFLEIASGLQHKNYKISQGKFRPVHGENRGWVFLKMVLKKIAYSYNFPANISWQIF